MPRTTAEEIDHYPSGIPYIVSNEAAERFSYYGMTSILVTYMTEQVLDPTGTRLMTEPEAKELYHGFSALAYLLPLLGALLSETVLGKYRTILYLSLVYCLGHLVLAVDLTRTGLLMGLGLIAIGAGGIKPCVSTHLGDQFGQKNQHLVEHAFGWFYFSINLGSASSIMMIPWIKEHYGYEWAFGVPGIFMGLATVVFFLGREKFVHVPPSAPKFLADVRDKESLRLLGKLVPVFLLNSIFWALFYQIGSSWVFQAKRMDLRILDLPGLPQSLRTWELLPEQVGTANPFMVMLLIPLMSLIFYPCLTKWIRLTAMRKMAAGCFFTGLAYLISAGIEANLPVQPVEPSTADVAAEEAPSRGSEEQTTSTESLEKPSVNIRWQILAYLFLTIGEVLISVTALDFAYSIASKNTKAIVTAINSLSISIGNVLAGLVNTAIKENTSVRDALAGARYYQFFMILVVAAGFGFIILAYREQAPKSQIDPPK